MQSSSRRQFSAGDRRAAVLGLLLPALLVAAVFAWNVADGWFLGDDAFISFRYARNLADGLGPVWNPGERVEGYTNFLWVVLMAGVLRAGAAPEIVSCALGVVAGAGVLATLVFLLARSEPRAGPLLWLPALALAGHRSFGAWCTGGLETMLFTFLVLAGYVRLLRERGHRSGLPVGSALLLGLAALTRPEGWLFAAIAGLLLLADLRRPGRNPRRIVAWVVTFLTLAGTHLVWRQAYYGEWLPNSFHAKVPAAWWDQGLQFLRLYVDDYRQWWVLPLLLPAIWVRRRADVLLPCAATAIYLGYVASVGGDRFEFRFIVPVLPFVYLILTQVLVGLREMRGGRVGTGLAYALALGLVLSSWSGGRSESADGVRQGIAGLRTIERYAARRSEEGRFLRSLVDAGELPEDLMLCVGGAGALPYYTRWPTVDRRGINDYTIARLPLAERGVVAHERDAPQTYLQERGVVLFDIFNRVVHTEQSARAAPATVHHDGVEWPVRIVRAGGRLLVFVSPAGEQAYRQAFAALP